MVQARGAAEKGPTRQRGSRGGARQGSRPEIDRKAGIRPVPGCLLSFVRCSEDGDQGQEVMQIKTAAGGPTVVAYVEVMPH